MRDLEMLQTQLTDRRSKRVIFLSHCLLNENTRYLGGACCAGCVRTVVEKCVAEGYGIVQMPCPEQDAWGGVVKPLMLMGIGAKWTWVYRLRSILFPLFMWRTRRIYRRLARSVAAQIEDYLTSSYTIVSVVGINGSPSCGVDTTLDMKMSLDLMAGTDIERMTVETMNHIVKQSLVQGAGLFTQLLNDQLRRRGLAIEFAAHDLIAELDAQEKPTQSFDQVVNPAST